MGAKSKNSKRDFTVLYDSEAYFTASLGAFVNHFKYNIYWI